MLAIQIDDRKLKQLQRVLRETPKQMPKELNKAINKTLKGVESNVAKAVTSEIRVTQKVVKESIKKKRSSASTLTATVTLKQTTRIPLREFGARQKKSGVSYKISKTGSRKTVIGAFQGPRPGVMKASWRGRVLSELEDNACLSCS